MKIHWHPLTMPRPRDYRPALAFLAGMALIGSLGYLWQFPWLYTNKSLHKQASPSMNIGPASDLSGRGHFSGANHE